ncbi:mannose-1-phosphate guanylyltransferase/mannose-6-phosphate isomerase [Sphingomonas kaistensis]|uniref:mannose-1-phosphate guanylyltransferase n=1 Tax=Sphingomonas kaistensis TaxID=298708 RepID=A0A7X6BEN8_9SPHN|nr:mannose-1-phosphate guanylyltransferase/mannose-6-phosphate isomerase [Sphingomonas kaistensis]NJC04479.1 mannose-1-phosphate guanylyltransferase/mannose-6-phosphate isomerase [Sphingomonas kaistensis]
MTDSEQSRAAAMPASIRPVILCGGAGTRLWPLSRAQFPKQLASFDGGPSLLQNTVARASGSLFSPPLLITAEDQRFLVRDQVEDGGAQPECIILEQQGRNTAPALAVAAQWLADHRPGEVMLVLPSDHVIDDVPAFHAAIAQALPQVARGKIVTFGVRPTSPHTGYGYIRVDPEALSSGPVVDVAEFVEKPSLDKAEAYVASGAYFWNAGIFLFRAEDFLTEIAQHAPGIAAWAAAAVSGGGADGAFFRPAEDNDAAPIQPISVDYAVMERSRRVAVVPVDMGWSDLGSWNEIWSRSDHDGHGNALQGSALAVDTAGSLVIAGGDTTVATLGLKDVVVVAVDGAVLVSARDRVQDVGAVVKALKETGDSNADLGSVVHRPWGSYQTTDRDARFQTKRIIVRPGGKLSSQLHHHRSEHWVVVTGTAEVTVGERTFLLHENESTYISAGTVHRLANPGKVPLHLVEVQCGTYLGEDDIVRFDDVYGRADQG